MKTASETTAVCYLRTLPDGSRLVEFTSDPTNVARIDLLVRRFNAIRKGNSVLVPPAGPSATMGTPRWN